MLTIKKATEKDIAILIQLEKEFTEYHPKLIAKNPVLKEHLKKDKNFDNIITEYVKKVLPNKDEINFIAFVGKEPAGFIHVKIKNNVPIFAMKKLGGLGPLLVREKFRGLKISSKLRDEAFKWLRKKGIKYVTLHVYEANEHARNIYKKWGFFDYKIEMRKKI